MPFVNARGVKLNYRQDGEGPDVVLVHGVAGNMAVWFLCGLIAKLADQFCVTSYDLRGHGYSESTPSNYTSADMAADLDALCRELKLDRPYLVGHSFGCSIAVQQAIERPDSTRGLIISDAYFPGLAHLQANPGSWPGWEMYKARAAELGIEISGDWLNLEDLFRQAAEFTPKQREQFIELAGEATLERMVRAASTTCGRDVSDVAGLTEERILQLKTPAVCIYGERSPFIPTCDFLVSHLPNVTKSLIPDAEHFAFEENPDAFCDLVSLHLCKLAGLQTSESAAPSSDVGVRRTSTMMSNDPPKK